jgi:hypothetical protein
MSSITDDIVSTFRGMSKDILGVIQLAVMFAVLMILMPILKDVGTLMTGAMQVKQGAITATGISGGGSATTTSGTPPDIPPAWLPPGTISNGWVVTVVNGVYTWVPIGQSSAPTVAGGGTQTTIQQPTVSFNPSPHPY